MKRSRTPLLTLTRQSYSDLGRILAALWPELLIACILTVAAQFTDLLLQTILQLPPTGRHAVTMLMNLVALALVTPFIVAVHRFVLLQEVPSGYWSRSPREHSSRDADPPHVRVLQRAHTHSDDLGSRRSNGVWGVDCGVRPQLAPDHSRSSTGGSGSRRNAAECARRYSRTRLLHLRGDHASDDSVRCHRLGHIHGDRLDNRNEKPMVHCGERTADGVSPAAGNHCHFPPVSNAWRSR